MHKAGNDLCFLHAASSKYTNNVIFHAEVIAKQVLKDRNAQKLTVWTACEHLPDDDCLLLKCVLENTEQ